MYWAMGLDHWWPTRGALLLPRVYYSLAGETRSARIPSNSRERKLHRKEDLSWNIPLRKGIDMGFTHC